MGMFSGPGGGLGGLGGMSLYEDADGSKKAAMEAEEIAISETEQSGESEFVFAKTYTCPTCAKEFKALTVKSGKGKLIGTHKNLRPEYDGVEPLKYDVVMCPKCGTAMLTRYWGGLTPTQAKKIKTEVSAAFTPKTYVGNTYTYDEALERYQMALANAIAKQSKASEIAYICLKTGWLLEAKAVYLDPATPDYEEQVKSLSAKKKEYLENALDQFIKARMNEHFPIAGMDEITLDYLVASLSVEFGQYEQAAKLIGNILVSKTASSRMKDKARELKDEIVNALK